MWPTPSMTAPLPSCSLGRQRRANTQWRPFALWTPLPCGQRRTSTTPNRMKNLTGSSRLSIAAATAHAACTTAMDIGADAILTVSQSGNTAQLVSRFRPGTTVVACLLNERVQRQMALYWGVVPLLMPYASNTDQLIDFAIQAAERAELVKQGDLVVITAGVPVGVFRYHQYDQGASDRGRSAQRRWDWEDRRTPLALSVSAALWRMWLLNFTPAMCWWSPILPMIFCPISARPPL